MRRSAASLFLCGLFVLSACEGGHDLAQPTVSGKIAVPGATADWIPLRRVPKWMDGYCHKATDDLRYAVLCPRRLPRVLDIIPCRGPAPAEELWGKYCFDFVLDALFTGPPGYEGPFATNRRTGHLAVWAIGADSDFYPDDGLFACPGGGRREEPELIAGHSGYWWTCPETKAANVNSGHVAFQWSMGDVVLGTSVHGMTAENRKLVRELLFESELVSPGP
jgi:hypothetical protein